MHTTISQLPVNSTSLSTTLIQSAIYCYSVNNSLYSVIYYIVYSLYSAIYYIVYSLYVYSVICSCYFFLPTGLYNTGLKNTQAITMLSPHMTYSDGLRPPPMIPATPTFQIAGLPSGISPSRPVTAPRNPYALQPSTQAHGSSTAAIMTPAVHNNQQFANTQLPKLTLPTLSGDPLDWLLFWDLFYYTIYMNPSLSGI